MIIHMLYHLRRLPTERAQRALVSKAYVFLLVPCPIVVLSTPGALCCLLTGAYCLTLPFIISSRSDDLNYPGLIANFPLMLFFFCNFVAPSLTPSPSA